MRRTVKPEFTRCLIPPAYWSPTASMVKFEDVSMIYPSGDAKAINDMTFTIQDGEFVFLVGPSGSGKTSVIKLITGEVEACEGELSVNGFDLRHIHRRKLPAIRRTIGVIFQDFRLIEDKTVFDNVAFAMRTDSLRLSEDARAAVGDFIQEHYGKDYYPGKPRRFKTDANAQDAHEAIRPSVPSLTPDRVRKSLTIEQYRLYRLIWGRFTASQMANAVYDNITIDASCEGNIFRAYHSEIQFPGYTAVYEDNKDDEESETKKPLPELKEGEEVNLIKLNKEQNFTAPPSRYTEATLIRAMEEKGIGRPSTYAPTITIIAAREYVTKDGKYLKPTPLGQTVTKLMEQRFPDIVDVKFTARMESSLDEVEEGKKDWKSILDEFYGGFSDSLDKAEESLKGVHIKVPDEVSTEVCPNCGRNLVYKTGRFGRFLACPGYPACSFTMNELTKISKVIGRELPDADVETLLVIDATTGQNGLLQAESFAKAAGVTGIVLTKLDGTAKGGVVLSIGKTLGVPVKFVGVGEGVDDLLPFDAKQFAKDMVS